MNTKQHLVELAQEIKKIHLFELFQQNPQRFEEFHRKLEGILFDFSKQRIDQKVVDALLAYAEEKDLAGWMEKLFHHQTVNDTEKRSAMHWALRQPVIEDEDHPDYLINQAVHAELDKMQEIVDRIHSGQMRGIRGEQITHIVNIGVGGSDLGPLMVSHALRSFQQNSDIKVFFASTMDGSQLSRFIDQLNPYKTLFIVSSKSFTTIDTLQNAKTAKQWLIDHIGYHPSLMKCHFIGVSTDSKKMTEWGISPEHQLKLWDWVGGRYSLWSAIGLPIAISIGMENFRKLLAGAYAIDQHFRNTEWKDNLPILLALIGYWNHNFLNMHSHAILPYDGRLKHFTPYMQQLEMESNGKCIKRNHEYVEGLTCPVIWGGVGPNAQHAFYQLLHQGTEMVSTDFIIAKKRTITNPVERFSKSNESFQQQHKVLIANCLAQSRLLAFGNEAVPECKDLPLFQQYQGNKPSTTMIIPELDPYHLGALIAIYEHKVFVQSVLWDINPFDQWGVEMGKKIAKEILPILNDEPMRTEFDASTKGLIDAFMTVESFSC